MDLKRDDHVKLAEKLKQIQHDAEAINKVMQATYRKEFARAAHQIAHDLMSLRLSLAHKLDEELPDARRVSDLLWRRHERSRERD